jgi:acetylornithine deacetylase/succinyl-diaminopimelate desuccinylase-like protein
MTSTIQSARVPVTPLETVITYDDIVWEMFGQVNKVRALTDLRKLTGETPICTENECYTIKNRLTGSEGLYWAKEYIYDELIKLGYSVEFRDWSSSGYADQNLIAMIPGTLYPDEEIYFVAHLDGVKNGLELQFPAADDNASGAVDILELARVLNGYSFSRTVVLFFSTGEEQGRLGVKSYLSHLSLNELSSIKYVVNIDMIGYDEDNNGIMELWHGDHPPSVALAQMMSEIIIAYKLDLTPRLVIGCG